MDRKAGELGQEINWSTSKISFGDEYMTESSLDLSVARVFPTLEILAVFREKK